MKIDLRLRRLARAALEELGVEDAVLDIYLVPDDLMQEINYRYRKKNRPTNVLSFPASDGPYPETDRRPLGEIYLAPRFIKAHNQNIYELLIHGLLHLLGYDHKGMAEGRKMRLKEEELKHKLLVSRCFSSFGSRRLMC